MMQIIRWELARRKLYLVWWCVGAAVLISLLMAIYPSLHQQAVELQAIMKQLPASVKALRGGDVDLTTPVGYLNAELFYITLPLLFIIMAVTLGGSLLARDEQDHTLELLLARPVSRGAILAGKACSGLILVASVGAVAAITTSIMTKVVGMDISLGYVLLATLSMVIFSTSFGAITYALNAASILSRRLGFVIAVVASFGGYLVQSLSSASDWLTTPVKFFPYHYYLPKDILAGTVDRGFVFYMFGVFLASIVISYLGFRRRDIG